MQAQAAAHYAQARQAHDRQDWTSALQHYAAAAALIPGYQDVATRLRDCQRRQQVEQLQARLHELHANHKDITVLRVAALLGTLDPAAVDQDIITTARQRLQ